MTGCSRTTRPPGKGPGRAGLASDCAGVCAAAGSEAWVWPGAAVAAAAAAGSGDEDGAGAGAEVGAEAEAEAGPAAWARARVAGEALAGTAGVAILLRGLYLVLKYHALKTIIFFT